MDTTNNPESTNRPPTWAETIAMLIEQMQASPVKSRELSLCITKLQEAGFWLAAVPASSPAAVSEQKHG